MAKWPYSTLKWQLLRAWVLRQQPLCVHCMELGKVVVAREVDHITPVSDGGAPFDEDNLQPLCKGCHSRKTRADNGGQLKGCKADGTPLDASHWWH